MKSNVSRRFELFGSSSGELTESGPRSWAQVPLVGLWHCPCLLFPPTLPPCLYYSFSNWCCVHLVFKLVSDLILICFPPVFLNCRVFFCPSVRVCFLSVFCGLQFNVLPRTVVTQVGVGTQTLIHTPTLIPAQIRILPNSLPKTNSLQF